jgi:hypothetical protein
MYKPRATRDIYVESLSVNSDSLKKQLADRAVAESEIHNIMDAVAKLYNEQLEKIVEECDRDMMALERVPSPLKLVIECLGRASRSLGLSGASRRLIQNYLSAWEDWM